MPTPLASLHAQIWPKQHELLRRLLAELGGACHPLNRAVLQEVAQGGRRLRSVLPSACLRVLAPATPPASPQARAALWLGLALELVHIGTLCHDDVMDGDRVRRNRPSAWQRIGTAQAITLGDYLFFVAQEAVHRAPLDDGSKLATLRDLVRLAQLLARGQALEDTLRARRILPTAESHLEVARGKTGALLAAALRFGGRCAGSARLDDLESLGLDLGHAYQLADDLADFVGQKGRDVAGCDLWEGKPSWLVAHAALGLDPDAAAQLAANLYCPRADKTAADVEALRFVLERACASQAASRRLGLLVERLRASARSIDAGIERLVADLIVPMLSASACSLDSGRATPVVGRAA